MHVNKQTLAYVIGLALGDGNLSRPKRCATRLRITCDTRYKELLNRIIEAIQSLLPDNNVGIIKRSKSCVDVSCYSNRWEEWLGWKAENGSKFQQQASIPKWIKENKKYFIPCLRGLIETDGSIYLDRTYPMINFVNSIPKLAREVRDLIEKLGFKAHLYKVQRSDGKTKYTVRVSRDVNQLIHLLRLSKN